MVRGLCSLVFLVVLGCAARDELMCNGSSCTCPSDTMCRFTANQCGMSSCSLQCGARAICTGSCGQACSVNCEREATCEIGVGVGGSVSCGDASDCHVTCPSDCSVSCGAGANCTIRCATDPEPRQFTGSASCP
jgi:hypothetical protein